MTRAPLFICFTLVATALLIAGCERKFTRERFEMIHPHADDRADVRHILGEPAWDTGEEWFYQDEDRHLAAQIFFDRDGRVQAKEWMDATTGTWEGRNPHTNPPPEGEPREKSTRTRTVDKP